MRKTGILVSHKFTPYIVVFAFLLPIDSPAQEAAEQATPSAPDQASASLSSQETTEPQLVKDDHLTTEQIEESLGKKEPNTEEESWVDSSHEYIGTKADDLAIYMDRFFGDPLEDLESADSTIRLVSRFEWDEDDGSDIRLQLRGKLHLPRLSERVSLVFSSDEDEAPKEFESDNTDSDNDNKVALQVNAAEGPRSRFDLTLSASSGLNLKPGVRYRFKQDLEQWGRFRYTARVDYSDRNRFRQKHAIELDYLTGESSHLRWANKVEHGQRSEGLEWSSFLSWRYGYNIDSAMAIALGVVGKTEPEIPDFILDDPPYIGREPSQDSLLTNYVALLTFRQRLYKDWLYVEFEPGYTRRQRHHFEDRHGVFFGRVNFEIFFNRGREREKKATTGEGNPAEQTTAVPQEV